MATSENTGTVVDENTEQESYRSNQESYLEELAEQIVRMMLKEIEIENYRSGN
jgi:hypothetical protein